MQKLRCFPHGQNSILLTACKGLAIFVKRNAKNLKKGVDEEKCFVLYYDSRADESREELQRTLKPYAVQDVP